VLRSRRARGGEAEKTDIKTISLRDFDLNPIQAQNSSRLPRNKECQRLVSRVTTQRRKLPSMTKEEAAEKARKDLAKRLGINESQVSERSVADTDFPDMALGAGAADEMSGQMITRGWKIQLEASGKTYEYRADKNQLRAYKFNGKNYKI